MDRTSNHCGRTCNLVGNAVARLKNKSPLDTPFIMSYENKTRHTQKRIHYANLRQFYYVAN